MIDFSQRVTDLEVAVAGERGGDLRRRSQYEFDYAPAARRPVSLLMPVEDRAFRDNELFAVMDMNLPEGFLLAQLRERAPKSPPTKMQLLALAGGNGIGRLGFHVPEQAPSARGRAISRKRLLREGSGKDGRIFLELVDAYLSTGTGLSGVQPKILVPDRATIPIPNVLVKAAGREYPGLAANEFLCLEVARRAGLAVPRHELSDDGSLLLIDRFDLVEGRRLGFEDLAALMDLRVGGALSDRKYRGSYQSAARVLGLFCSDPASCLPAFFEQLALSVLVRNGDAHLKNFGVLYDEANRRLAPLFDVVTTTVYPYERGGVTVTDRTMALRLNSGADRRYPLPDELFDFGRARCQVATPGRTIAPILDAMSDTLSAAKTDARIPKRLLRSMRTEWEDAQHQFSLSLG